MMSAQQRMTIKGTRTFQAFGYMLMGSRSLRKVSIEHVEGAHFCRVASVLFAAFSVEACLNHVGEAKVPGWKSMERGLSWQAKLDVMSANHQYSRIRGVRPWQTVDCFFKFRDKLAHGKSETYSVERRYGEPFADLNDPDWLQLYSSDLAVERAAEDADWACRDLLLGAGMHPLDAVVYAHGDYVVVPDEEPGMFAI